MSPLWHLVVTAFFVACVCSTETDGSSRKQHLRSMGTTVLDVNEEDIRAAGLGVAFPHAADLMSAVHAKSLDFDVHESLHADADAPKENWNLADYHEASTKAFYDTKTSYTLRGETSQFVSLDHDDSSVQEVSASHVVHCSEANHLREEGTVLLGSTSGAWAAGLDDAARLSRNLLKTHADAGRSSLLLVRKVVKAEPVAGALDERCLRLTTEDVVPVELFDKMRVEALVKHPFRTSFAAESAAPSFPRRRAQGNVATPDAPLIACDQPGEADDQMTVNKAIPGLVTSTYGASKACLQYNYNANIFAMNYDYDTKSAVQDRLNIIDGVVCENCFAYMGAGFLVIAEYWCSKSIFSAEIKLAGGTGANVDISVTSPSISGTTQFTLLRPGSMMSIPLGGGVDISVGFGGLSGDISGSGGATGNAEFSAGFNEFMNIGMTYAGGAFSYPSNAISTNLPPSWSSSDLKLTAMNVVIDLVAIMDVSLSWGYLRANGNIQLSTHVEVDYGTQNQDISAGFGPPPAAARSAGGWTTDTHTDDAPTKSDAPTSVDDGGSSGSSSSRLLDAQAGEQTVRHFQPGDTVPIVFSYSDLPPGPGSIAYFSLVDEATLRSHQLFYEAFTVAPSGSGVAAFKWVVPWNLELLSAEFVHIAIKTSNKLSLVAKTPQFSLELRSLKSAGIFFWPAQGSVFPTDVVKKVSWKHYLLRYYEVTKGSYRVGYVRQSKNVHIELFCEKLSPKGDVIASYKHTLNNGKTVRNTGSAHITIPSKVTKGFDRFYMVVRSHTHSFCAGFSTGFFTVSKNPAALKVSPAAFSTYGALSRVSKILGKPEACAASPTGFKPPAFTEGFRLLSALATPAASQESRALQNDVTCPSLKLTYYVVSSGALSSLCFASACASVGITSQGMQLMEPSHACFTA